MTKLFGLFIVRNSSKPSRIISNELDLSQFGFFVRGKVGEFFAFSALTLAERTSPGIRQSVEGNSESMGLKVNAVLHAYTSLEGLSVVVLTDNEYPTRVAYSLITKSLDEFCKIFPKSVWSSTSVKLTCEPLKDLLEKYKDPAKADPILQVHEELKETKFIVHKTIEKVLERGEKLEDLVNKSEQLSGMSKAFYKDAKKANACCSYFS